MANKQTKLVIRVIQPPISIFEIVGNKEIERTYAYESAFANAEDYFFMVPDGRFKVTQGKLVCCYDVIGGEVKELKPRETKTKEVKATPKEVVKGVTLNDVVASEKKKDKKDKNSVTGIMHVGEDSKK